MDSGNLTSASAVAEESKLTLTIAKTPTMRQYQLAGDQHDRSAQQGLVLPGSKAQQPIPIGNY